MCLAKKYANSDSEVQEAVDKMVVGIVENVGSQVARIVRANLTSNKALSIVVPIHEGLKNLKLRGLDDEESDKVLISAYKKMIEALEENLSVLSSQDDPRNLMSDKQKRRKISVYSEHLVSMYKRVGDRGKAFSWELVCLKVLASHIINVQIKNFFDADILTSDPRQRKTLLGRWRKIIDKFDTLNNDVRTLRIAIETCKH